MKGKIIQICSAPSNLYAVYTMDGEKEHEPILCLALTDKGEILIMDTDGVGQVDVSHEQANFEYFTWKKD